MGAGRGIPKITICLLTDETCPFLDLRPNTKYPPSNPAKNVSYGPSLPGSEPICFNNSIVVLYIVAYFARFWACVLVALNMSVAFSRTVPDRKRNIILCHHIRQRIANWQEESVGNGIHQRVWKPNFGAIYSAIASCFQNRKPVRVLRIKNDALESFLSRPCISMIPRPSRCHISVPSSHRHSTFSRFKPRHVLCSLQDVRRHSRRT